MTVSVSSGRASSCQVNIISVSGVCLVIDCNTRPDIGRVHFQHVHHSEWSPEAGEERVGACLPFCSLTVTIKIVTVHALVLDQSVHCKIYFDVINTSYPYPQQSSAL